jgi:hypothetical protein
VAEGAALEMPCRGNSTVGSNPTPSAIYFHPQHGEAMLTVGQTVRAFVGAQSVVATARDRSLPLQSVQDMSSPGGEKGSAARRRPKAGREAYSLYVERPDKGANEADGPLSASGKSWPC